MCCCLSVRISPFGKNLTFCLLCLMADMLCRQQHAVMVMSPQVLGAFLAPALRSIPRPHTDSWMSTHWMDSKHCHSTNTLCSTPLPQRSSPTMPDLQASTKSIGGQPKAGWLVGLSGR